MAPQTQIISLPITDMLVFRALAVEVFEARAGQFCSTGMLRGPGRGFHAPATPEAFPIGAKQSKDLTGYVQPPLRKSRPRWSQAPFSSDRLTNTRCAPGQNKLKDGLLEFLD